MIGFAQWGNTYGESLVYEDVKRVIECTDGSITVIGKKQYPNPAPGIEARYFWVLKLNSQGDTLWSNEYGIPNSYNNLADAVHTDDGGYMLAGTQNYGGGGTQDYNVIIIKIDSIGSQQWIKDIGRRDSTSNQNLDESAYAVDQTSDGGYVIIGHAWNAITSFNTLLIRTNSVGDTLFTKYILGTAGGNSQPFDVQETSDFGYVIIEEGYMGGSCALIKTDVWGNELWRQSHSSIKQVYETSDNGFILLGDGSIIKTDNLGNQIWQQTLSFTTWGGSFNLTSEGGSIIAGKKNSTPHISKRDSLGNEQWSYSFGDPTLEDLMCDVIESANGEYIAAGRISQYPYNWPLSYNIFVFRTDSSGILSGCMDPTALNYCPYVNLDNGSCYNPMTYVPDDNFEQYIENLGLGNGIIDDSVFTLAVDTIANLGVQSLSITDLTGIEDFTSLTYLDCSGNQLISLDLSNNTTLTYLDCSGNQLTTLDVTNNISLNTFYCQSNQLTFLDVRNGNNTNMVFSFYVNFTNNTNLYCISVDDPIWSNANWTNIDPWSLYNLDCSTAYGCTDSTAINYNTIAVIDDGSCIPFIYGCLDSIATNYNVSANTDDGSCTFCYATAHINNGLDTIVACDSIQLISILLDSGTTYQWNAIPSLGTFYEGGVFYYLDATAQNGYVVSVNNHGPAYQGCSSNGSAPGQYPTGIGTGLQNTINLINACGSNTAAYYAYNLSENGYSDWFLPSQGEVIAMSCFKDEIEQYGSSISSALVTSSYYSYGFVHAVNITGVCQYSISNYYNHSNYPLYYRPIREVSTPLIQTSNSNSVMVSNSGWNYVTVTDSLGCTATDSVYVHIDICGCTDPTALNYNPAATSDDGSCIATVLGCLDSTQFNYNVLANTDDGSCIAVAYGCTDSLALNYNLIANTDDGSCTGCLFYNNKKTFSGSNECFVALIADSVLNQSSTHYVNVYAAGSSADVLEVPYLANDLVQIDLSYEDVIGLKSDGTVLLWGSSYSGGNYVHLNSISARYVAMSGNGGGTNGDPLIILNDGSIYLNGSVVSSGPFLGNDFIQIEGGDNYIVALKRDGSVVTSGPVGGQYPPAGLDNVIEIAAGDEHILALKTDGSMVAWGNNVSNCTVIPSFLNDAISIEAGSNRNMVIRSDNSVWVWGEVAIPSWDLNSIPSSVSDVIAIETSGNGFNAALKSNGQIISWVAGNASHLSSINGVYINPLQFIDCQGNSSQPGCMDSLAVNYDSTAVADDGSCLYCYATADIGADTINGCDSVLISTNPITNGSNLWNTSNPLSTSNLAIGDTYQGGLVFYLDGNGGGLIVAPSDQSTAADWGCYGTVIPGADGTAIGTGAQNTIDIEAGCTISGTAADICANLTLGGYSDWFLPSKDELNEMYLNKNSITGINNLSYWSSTNYDNNLAWDQNLGNGIQNSSSKSYPYYVRAIRSFSYLNSDTINSVIVTNSGWNYVTVTDSLGCIATDSVYVNITPCVLGCTNTSMFNYNPLANVNDSSCIPYIYGCMDSLATNYNSTANTDDGSCNYCNYLSMTLSQSPVSCSGWNDGTVSANVSGGTPPYNYSWSTGDTTSQIDNLTEGMYIITISDGVCSFTDSITVELSTAPADSMHPEICYVSVDNTGFNRVVLSPLENPLTSQYVIYREYGANLYTPLDTIDANTLEYVDSTSNPSVQAERYKVSAIDACGNGTDTSDYHKTVHLTMSLGVNGEVNLIWNSYEGYQVVNYLIYRGNSASNMNMIGTISGTNTSFTDLTPPSGFLQYQIRAFAQNCNPIPNATILPDTLESNIIDHNNSGTTGLTVSITSQDPSCSSCNDGYAFASASNGVSPYTYMWSNGVVGAFNFNIGVGTYTVFVSDSDGNTDSESVTLTSLSVSGCTDPTANNYDPTATTDDGSCTYPSICTEPTPTGLFVSNIVHNRATINWDNMNDANCTVDQYRIKYREVGTNSWSQKNMGTPIGSCTWACNKTDKLILGLNPGTTYEYQIKAWYCGAGNSSWSDLNTFTTLDACPNIGNLTVSTPNSTKATFNWDASNGNYEFVRIKSRVDSISNPSNADWFNVGGAGVSYPTFTKNKNNLTPGETYRAQARTWCDPNGGPYKSDTWTPLVYWTQPTIRIEGGESIVNLEVYPNPSNDVFNISFSSEYVQDLKVRILNVIGEELIVEDLQQFIGEYTKKVSLNENAKGIYFLEIETNDGVVNKKLILQ